MSRLVIEGISLFLIARAPGKLVRTKIKQIRAHLVRFHAVWPLPDRKLAHQDGVT